MKKVNPRFNHFRIWTGLNLGNPPKFPLIIIIGNILEMAKSQNDDKE